MKKLLYPLAIIIVITLKGNEDKTEMIAIKIKAN